MEYRNEVNLFRNIYKRFIVNFKNIFIYLYLWIQYIFLVILNLFVYFLKKKYNLLNFVCSNIFFAFEYCAIFNFLFKFFLKNKQKFDKKFLRFHMIEQLALHVSEFTSRLTSNVKALYEYCSIPLIEYPQLKDELFCHLYYLRHLTDEIKFPNWLIREPVIFFFFF